MCNNGELPWGLAPDVNLRHVKTLWQSVAPLCLVRGSELAAWGILPGPRRPEQAFVMFPWSRKTLMVWQPGT